MDEGKTIRPGTSLEDRVVAYLRKLGYFVEQHKFLAGHEIDVWGELEGKTIVVECKEYYLSGPVQTGDAIKFIGVITDLRNTFGFPDEAMFISLSGFSEQAIEMLNRNGIMTIDRDCLLSLEQDVVKLDDLRPTTRIQDKAILKLKVDLDKLKRELERRQQINKLSEEIEKLKLQLNMETLPSFLQPAKISTQIPYSGCKSGEVPIIGLEGTFVDFLVLNYPNIDYILYSKRGFLGQKLLIRPPGALTISRGIIYVHPSSPENITNYDEYEHGSYLLGKFIKRQIITLNNVILGRVKDFIIGVREGYFAILAVEVDLNAEVSAKVGQKTILLPSNRVREESNQMLVLANFIQV